MILLASGVSYAFSMLPIAKNLDDYSAKLLDDGSVLISSLANPWVPIASFVLTIIMYTAIMLFVIRELNNVMLRIRFDEDVISLSKSKQSAT